MTDRRPRSDADSGIWPTIVPNMTVHETTPDVQPSGLVDRHGVPLVRRKPSMGFIDFDLLRRSK